MSKVDAYDVIIVGDDAALRFAMEHLDDLFAGIPVIFEGINSAELAMEAAQSPLVTGVMEILSFEKNIELAKTFYPNPENKAVYDRNFKVYKNLYKANKENFAILNGED